ncbi:hypothetical protein TNIN_232611 [Trichonephila inaurata madagascariensis]|uniref:Uncharacterized protein n=1 Tax=Trichonephila inaurata madagascariensis TaxID=2747483 RepID=A0A8X6WMI7_9ARAC|nr:hypothetical protein TNIN_232611 [Trichonephila inaurata madagascariensis]
MVQVFTIEFSLVQQEKRWSKGYQIRGILREHSDHPFQPTTPPSDGWRVKVPADLQIRVSNNGTPIDVLEFVVESREICTIV